MIEIGEKIKENSLSFQPNQSNDKIFENNDKKEKSLEIFPRLDFKKTIENNNNQNLESKRNPKTSENPCFRKKVQNVSKKKILKIRKKHYFKRFNHRNITSKISFIKIFKEKDSFIRIISFHKISRKE